MNVNGSRFHLLLGKADWGRCFVPVSDGFDESTSHLEQLWDVPTNDTPAASAPLIWDTARDELSLPSEAIVLGATPGEIPFTLDARRSAAADRNGNIYWIDTDTTRLRVWSVGSDRESAFWPDGPANCRERQPYVHSDFEPLDTRLDEVQHFTALAVTEDHYLVVAFTSPTAQGLLSFDLMAGGAPLESRWPASVAFIPFDMIQRRHGGVWILDRQQARLWELDRRLSVVSCAQTTQTLIPAETDIFQPTVVSSPEASRQQAAQVFPAGVDLVALIGESIDPIGVEVLDDAHVLILDRNQAAGQSRIFCLQRQSNSFKALPAVQLPELAQDFVVTKAHTRSAPDTAPQLLVATASGNQALAFDIHAAVDVFDLRPTRSLFPLRRFNGRAVFKVRDIAWYDSGLESIRWVPIVQHPRARYREAAELMTPVFDGLELQCTWDRLILDACIPADSTIEVFCRTADEAIPCAELSPPAHQQMCEIISGWHAQPKLYLRHGGGELPWLRAEAQPTTQRTAGIGTWELLLQNMQGRYLQIKLRLTGNGMLTPRLRALRVWYPRFSYSRRFLPAVYREDAVSGDFIERFLANMEGINTQIEDRIVNLQALFDPDCAPSEALVWLAGWFDMALDPNWEEWRQRLLIKHAMDFFRWRGTVHGLRLALSLAFQNCLTAQSFAEPNPETLHLQAIRIVETYLTRKVGAAVAGDAGAVDNIFLPPVNSQKTWSPQEGNTGLWDRYAEFMNKTLTTTEKLQAFDLKPPREADLHNRWWQFCLQHLGFVPSAGAAEHEHWQRYLLIHASDDDQESQELTPEAIAYPADWPPQAVAQKKWRAFAALANAERQRWQDFLARRYRRIGKLNRAYQTDWPGFDLLPLPDVLPTTPAAQTDWLQFEKHLLSIVRTAHRFSVLLPVSALTEDPADMQRRMQLARRIVELEKPAHTLFDVRFYWALNRIGEARLGLDTLLDVGSRAPQLLPNTVLGRAYLGASFIGGATAATDTDRHLLTC